jgi:hypothetical protein
MRALVTVAEEAILPLGAEALWPYLVEEARLRAWRDGVEQFGTGDLPPVGETLFVTQTAVGRRVRGPAVLAQSEPGRALSYELGEPGDGYLAVRYDLWPQADGCKLVVSETVDAPGVPIIGPWLGHRWVAPRLRAELTRDLARLRQRLAEPA